jgi:hypothetical protein
VTRRLPNTVAPDRPKRNHERPLRTLAVTLDNAVASHQSLASDAGAHPLTRRGGRFFFRRRAVRVAVDGVMDAQPPQASSRAAASRCMASSTMA